MVHCAWCRRLRLGETWLDLADVSRATRRRAEAVRNASHGICPDCLARVSQTAEQERIARAS
jgi:hypothetical protein